MEWRNSVTDRLLAEFLTPAHSTGLAFKKTLLNLFQIHLSIDNGCSFLTCSSSQEGRVVLICSTPNSWTLCPVSCNAANRKSNTRYYHGSNKPRKMVHNSRASLPQGFAGPAALWNAVHTHSAWGIGGTCGKRLRQLHHTLDSTEEELKSSISDGNFRGNLGGFKVT